MEQSTGHQHLPGDRLIPFGDCHLNVSLAIRRHRDDGITTSPLILGVRQYCHGIGVTGGQPYERDRSRSVDWGVVDRMVTGAAPRCLAAFSGTGVVVIDGLEGIVRAFLDNVLTLEVDVIDAAELHALSLISRDAEAYARAAARRRLSEALRDEEEAEGMPVRRPVSHRPPIRPQQPALVPATFRGDGRRFVMPPTLRL